MAIEENIFSEVVTDPDTIWKLAEEAVIGGDEITLARLLNEHEKLFRDGEPPSSGTGGLRPDYAGGDAKSVLVRNHHFDSWNAFAEHREALKVKDGAIAQFEAAADAIVSGDTAALEALLIKNPDLIRTRSARKHHAALLHYVGANGVEYFRQKTPTNIVGITEVLVQAGAEVDATAEIYGGSTTLGLAATSVHPVLAGVQIPLLESLLQAGAAVDGPAGASTVLACLSNGRAEAAEFLAEHGARVDLEAAAALGRLDPVKSYFEDNGSLKASATEQQRIDGLLWACEFGRTSVVEFLVKGGGDAGAKGRPHGQTGLHWAAHNGHLEIARILVEAGAPVNTTDDRFHGTPLDWAVHGWDTPSAMAGGGSYNEVVALLVAAGARVDPEWLAGQRPLAEKIRADEPMLAALRGEI